MSKENLLKKIEQDAINTAKSIIEEVALHTETELLRLKEELDSYENAQKENALKIAEENLKRRLTVADIEARKIILAKKQQLIDKVYENAMDKIINLNDDEYISLVLDLLRFAAEDGDELVISKSDKKRITKTLLDKIAKEKSISLTLSKEVGEFLGGFILKNANYDKDLTLEAIIMSIRGQTESEIVKILLG